MQQLKVNELLKQNPPKPITCRVDTGCMIFGMGENTMRKIAEEAQAVIRINKIYLIDVQKVEDYLHNLAE